MSLKQYTGGIFQYLLTSQFVYPTPENCITLKNLRFKIQTKKQKKNSLHVFMVVDKTNSIFKKILSFLKKKIGQHFFQNES